MQRVLVTGGGRGIGKAVALAFAQAGAQVVITGRDLRTLAAVCDEAAPAPGTIVAVPGDVADPASASAAVSSAGEILGGLDVLVNNAGISLATPLDGAEQVDADWHRVLATNLHGPWWTSRAAVARMSPGGRIIMISAGLGQAGRAGYAAYCASKQALIGLVRCLALELAPRSITVNAVAPGGVATDLLDSELAFLAGSQGLPAADVRAAALRQTSFGRYIEPAEVAALVVYLASPQASGITAQMMGVEAGLGSFAS